jgi:phospholipid transport system substrate-binding protein
MPRIFGLAFALLIGAAAAASAGAATQTPEQIVQAIATDLDKALDGRKAELKQDHDKLISTIDDIFLPHFDIDYASILVLGRHAREATPAQRDRFAKAFYNSLVDRYAEGLLNYTRGSVRVLPGKGELNVKRSIVRTQVILDDGKAIAVDYAFRKTREGQWKAYDVIIEGISYITNYRNQVDAEIRRTSLDALITRLETQGEKALESLQPPQPAGAK